MKIRMRSLVFDNMSYKVVSLFITLILWITILGRQDFSLTKTVDVELIPGPNQILSMQSSDVVKIKVSGPRTALRKFVGSGLGQLVSIDISQKPEGDIDVEIPAKLIDVPFGVKVISVKPSVIHAHIIKK